MWTLGGNGWWMGGRSWRGVWGSGFFGGAGREIGDASHEAAAGPLAGEDAMEVGVVDRQLASGGAE